MKITSEELLNHLYYKKLPQVYRNMDIPLKLPFKRYLSALIDGGFISAVEDIENVMTLIDPEKCPSEFLPYLCESFGLEYFEDIDDSYQRKFLMNIGEITLRRGTYSCVRYLVKALTGLDVNLQYIRGEYNGQGGRHLIVTLLADTIEEANNIDNSVKVVERYIATQLPYYIYPQILSTIKTTILTAKTYRGNVITSCISYDLRPRH